jgi:hypothetical protein
MRTGCWGLIGSEVDDDHIFEEIAARWMVRLGAPAGMTTLGASPAHTLE